MTQAMDDWVERERQRLELIESLDEAEEEIERGEGIGIEDKAGLIPTGIRHGRLASATARRR